MGVERAVTRWYLQRQSILNEIATLEAKLARDRQTQEQKQGAGNSSEQVDAEIRQQLAKAQEKLRTLGPCPKPMMG
ncbi:MAG: hypothetical protein ACJ797_18845 [Ktedonobacteraceae bacterium]|jgi:hypothetical protein|nr:MAG: hypothetical protein E6J44_01450 [Chloroflexota bacterium]TMC88482.1 MAG: hypothetical protein E6J10_03010 [Chloroflexota bacterium]